MSRPELSSTKRARALLKRGLRPKEIIAQIPNIEASTISRLRRMLGYRRFRPGRPRNSFMPHTLKRIKQIRSRIKRGEVKMRIAKSLGINRQRLDQLIHPDRNRARRAVHRAIRNGTIKRPNNCQKCGRTVNLEAHHNNYRHHLKVEWLCTKCHTEITWNKKRKTT